ncbi:type I polyketide synthase [Aspergillus novofumigatus IBT 16806]|uniref:Uncharacterized protein n=1 Tax=Aspergillus novofumigatus (strain IBT 16806) TaxID=1392255 RepID=A0A2I1C137_ASPN1|nr:uncharacterized protein P174DRAFT_422527 [Aspergillus novofumigatus IBT 16806]PKX91350.1 hypothetical protein P174DRAFT_422527 [Aspergillus novofumigatus IBT 16806]
MHLANGIDRTTFDGESDVLHHNTLPAALPRTPDELPSNSLEGTLPGVQTIPEPIAIVGMALRLPGGITSPESFWELLLSGGDVRSRVPASRYNVDSFYSPSSKTGSVKSTYGYFLENGLKEFDTSFFSMNKIEVEMLDPQQRQLLEVVWECMERAGQTNWRGENIGCYVGVYGEDWLDLVSKDTQDDGIYRISGAGDFLLANRISYEYDLKGPSMTTKTGCSSSLICLHAACQALLNGDCDSAIVGGTNLIMSPGMTVAMSQQGVLSPSGSCKTFDAAADGYARAEAINAIYIKKLSDAIAHGDPIRAVIRSTATNCDGKTPGLAVPSSETHEAMIRRAYKVAGLPASQTGYVECHGTGTPVGDPLEVQSIANVFGNEGVYIGSVKPNVGHSEGASGITSIIKCILALENRVIPPNIKLTTPNPKIPWEESKLRVPKEPTPWPAERLERASVNSFGIGGANAHVILDSAASVLQPSSLSSSPRDTNETKQNHLLVFSANHPDSLQRLISSYQEYAARSNVLAADLAYTLAARREHLPHRAFCILNGQTWKEVSRTAKAKSAQTLNFVFTGQGAQWPGMGKELIQQYSSFRKDIHDMDRVLQELPHPPTWTIRGALETPGTAESMSAELSQPLCTAIQVAIVNLLREWGITPAAVVGHSSGEIAAAYTAGPLQLGAMAAVGLGRHAVAPHLIPGVSIACENSPDNVTLSGNIKEVEQIMASLKEEHADLFVRRLKVNVAYHSDHMAVLGAGYESLLAGYLVDRQPKIPFYSSVTRDVIKKAGALSASYWRKNLESPVLFKSAVERLVDGSENKNHVFLEIGPHSALSTPTRQILQSVGIQAPYIATLQRGQDGHENLLTTLGNLYLEGLQPHFAAVYGSEEGTLLHNTPNYPWHHEAQYWYESRISREWRLRPFPRHELLGSRILEGNDLEPTWRNVLRLSNVPWLRDHKVHEDIVFPAAGYIAMAGEAVRQVTRGAVECARYSLRRLNITSAMILQDTQKTEVMTSLRSAALTTSLDSEWYDFSVVSFNGSSWTKHCFGQVRADWEGERKQAIPQDQWRLPRAVPSPLWYQTLRDVGYNYGPEFQGLQDIAADTLKQMASATVLDADHRETSYQLHPTTIDFCLQMISTALAQGIPRHLRQLVVPTEVEEIQIERTSSPIHLLVTAQSPPGSNGEVRSDISGFSGDSTEQIHSVVNFKGIKLMPLSNDGHTEAIEEDPHAGAQLRWAADVDFIDSRTLINPLGLKTRSARLLCERLTVLCIIDTHDRLSSLPPGSSAHLDKFRAWIKAETARAQQGDDELIEDAQDLAKLNVHDRRAIIEAVAAEIQSTEMAAIGTGIMQVHEASELVHKGEKEPLEVLMLNNALTNLYNLCHSLIDVTPLLSAIGHENPTLRVLEIGAGTGGTTAAVLEALKKGSAAELRYSSYTFTDISAGFFAPAKERFKAERLMRYATLNIEQDPSTQGFESGQYDLIIASNVFHATSSLQTTLKHVRQLLHPRGRLVFIELSPRIRFLNYIMGILPGWWLGEADGRVDTPFVSVDRWDQELRDAGFNGVEASVYDDDTPHQIDAVIVARPKETLPSTSSSSLSLGITLLISDNQILSSSTVIETVTNICLSKGLRVDVRSLGETLPRDQDIISLLDLDGPFFLDIDSERLKQFQAIAEGLVSSGMLWVTRSAQVGCSEPGYALVLGLARTLRSELSIDLATLEVNEFTPSTWVIVLEVMDKFMRRDRSGHMDHDFEYALADGVVQIGRFEKFSVSKALQQKEESSLSGTTSAKRLSIGNFGSLQTLCWVDESSRPLQGREIRVATRAVGLNFRDVVGALGVVEIPRGFGFECAGIVTEIGPDVENLQPGDRVVVLDGGSFATLVTTRADFCVRLPQSLTFEEAASMPVVYGTVIYALIDLARLESGQTILVQSAAGGVGIAAIQIAQYLGATVYATVGNEEKVQFLTETFGLPRHHIFHSRNTSFLPDLLRETNGKGVDVVLNSLSGQLLHASWECVAEFGKMIEIGKRDFVGHGKLEMNVFEKNRAFFGVDLWTLTQTRPALGQSLLERSVRFFEDQIVKPISPLKTFNAREIGDAFSHIFAFDPNRPKSPAAGGSLLPSVFLSRSATSPAHTDWLAELRSQGCEVQTISGSVIDLDDVKLTVENASKPIGGVIQMSMVLRDQGYLQMSHEEWQTAVAPKVRGTLNLHEATQESPLDFFVLFSSISGVIGQVGQANYAAGNTFLDAFCQYRRQLSLPASVLDIGVLGDIGYASRNSTVLQKLKTSGFYLLREQELLDSLQFAIFQSTPSFSSSSSGFPEQQGFCNPGQLVIGLRSTLSWTDTKNQVRWKRDRRMASYHNDSQGGEATTASTVNNEGLKQFLSELAMNPILLAKPTTHDLLAQEIGQQLLTFMLRPEEELDISQSLQALGMDSFVSIEIRNWIRQNLGVDLSVLDIMSSASVRHLGTKVADGLRVKYATSIDDAGDTYLLMKAP